MEMLFSQYGVLFPLTAFFIMWSVLVCVYCVSWMRDAKAEVQMKRFLNKEGDPLWLNRLKKFVTHPFRFVYHNLAKRGVVSGDRWARTFFGTRIKVSVKDEDGAVLYYSGTLGVKEQPIIRFFEREVRPHISVLDVGANYGFYTQLAAKRGAAVLAFEPGRNVLKYLKQNARGAAVFDGAVGAECGTLTFYDNEISKTGMSTAVKEAADENGVPYTPYQVDMTTIDHWEFADGESIIKIDVEGFEEEVLRGAEKTLKLKPTIIMEVATRPAVKEKTSRALAILEAAGYHPYKLNRNGTTTPTVIDLDAIELSDNFVFRG